MNGGEFLFLIIVFSVLFGIPSRIVLERKGRSGWGGFFLGFCLGPIGLAIALVLAPDYRALDMHKGQTE